MPTPSYTTSTIVYGGLDNFGTIDLDRINEWICEAEQILSAMGIDRRSDFDEDELSILRAFCNSYTQYQIILFNPNSYTTLEEAEVILNGKYRHLELILGLLSNPDIRQNVADLPGV